MSTISKLHVPIIDLTADKLGDVNLWIGQGKRYHNVPSYVSDELCRRMSAVPAVTPLLPSPSLSVFLLLDFPTPPITKLRQCVDPEAAFSFNNATHTSSECLQLPAPSRTILNTLMACAGQAMLDGKISIRHWTHPDIFLPFDALGTWGLIVEADIAKKAWSNAMGWMNEQHKNIPEQYMSRVTTLLHTVPWNSHIKGLGSGLSTTDMATFLSNEWLSDTHLDSMLSVAVHLHADTLSRMVPHTEIVSSDFASHILTSPLLETSPITRGYLDKAPKSILKLGSTISSASMGIRVAAISFSPPGHWACLIIDCQAGTICWGDSAGWAPPAGFEKRLKTWLTHFSPRNRFSGIQALPCARQTDGYSCGIVAINTLKHHIFGDELWNESHREILRVSEFLGILEFSESQTQPFATTDSVVQTDRGPLTMSLSSPPSQTTDTMSSNSSDCDSVTTPSSLVFLPPVQCAKRPLTPSSCDSSSSSLASGSRRAKRPRTLAYPPTGTEKQARVTRATPVGNSKQALSKRKAIDSVQNGTFARDPKRWDTYKKKLAELDPGFEVSETDPSRIRYVKHSSCGGWYIMAAPYDKGRFKKHVDDCSYSKDMGGMKTLEGFGIIVFPANAHPTGSSSLTSSSNTHSPVLAPLPCPGLTEKDSIHIRQYFARTSVASAGGKDIHSVAESLFHDEFKNLSSDKKDLVRLKQKQTHSWSVDHLMKTVHAIGKVPCEGNAQVAADGSLEPCKVCKALLSSAAFKKATTRKPALGKNRAYIPHVYQPAVIGKMYSLGFSDLLDGSSSHSETLTRFVRQVVSGNLDDKTVFLDLVQVLTVQAEQRLRGRGLQNMKYPPALDDWCHELLCICPEAYRSFRRQFSGRTERSFLDRRSKSPRFCQGISAQVLERAVKYLEDYQYPVNAPLALSVDDTKLLPAFRPYFDKRVDKWFLVGSAGDPLEISDMDTLESQIKDAKGQLATKLRLWVLQIPLPHVPPLILAVMPLASSTDAATIAAMEQRLLDILIASEKSLCIISLGSDGSIVERDARRALVRSGFAKYVTHSIPYSSGNGTQSEDIKISFLCVHGQYIAITQDPKHCRKTARNNLFSGARLLLLGNFPIYYEQIRSLASENDSPLYWRDVDQLDRQDDRAAARLFSAPFLRHCVSRHGETNLGLPIYLFVLGELVDAYENRYISHLERVKMVLRMRFFKSMWKSFLRDSGYPENRYFISAAADDIIDILVDGLICLVIIHRDHLETTFPLLPWMHGSEANEHLNVRLMAACKAKNVKVDFRRTAAGYSHTYFDADNIPLRVLSEFPSDHEISQAAAVAFDEASTLWDLLGYYHLGSHAPGPSGCHHLGQDTPVSSAVAGNSLRHISEPDEDADDSEEPEDTAPQDPDRRTLHDALGASNRVSGLDHSAQAQLDEYSYAAACLSFEDQEKIESLPDEDPEMQAALMQRVLEIVMEVENLTATEKALVQDNLTSITPGPFTQSSQPSAALDPSLDSETFSELSTLIRVRFRHQSEEEASSVRIARAGNTQRKTTDAGLDHDGSETATYPHKPNATTSQDSERRQLAKKINEVIKAGSVQTESAGLNRRNRWTTEKLAAGSAGPSTRASGGSDMAVVSGNVANAQAAARKSANNVLKQRSSAFASLKNSESLASAKVNLLCSLTNGCFGLAVVDDHLVMVEVLTMYEKSSGKGAKHSWTSSTASIGALSYLAVQCYQHTRQRQFRAMECTVTRTARFTHLSSLAFLCIVPNGIVRRSTTSHFLELLPGPFEHIFQGLNSEKDLVLAAVKGLLRPSRKNRHHEASPIEDADD
ncbi:hypothetical protein EDB84DRAFT_1679909 [Lactarius hengduanensis]|nr:hypothetical protein EDB84DRAFT_1679909 [Lactarius hengduanensis]